MTRIPFLTFGQVLTALGAFGFTALGERAGYIRVRRILPGGRAQYFSFPAESRVEREILARILREAGIPVEEFLEIVRGQAR